MLKNIQEKLAQNNVNYIYLNFIDLAGDVCSKGVLTHELIRTEHISINNGISVNGGIVNNGKMGNWLLLRPIIDSFDVIELCGAEKKIAYFLCDIVNSRLDSRDILSKAELYAKQNGYVPFCGLSLTYKMLESQTSAGGNYHTILGSPNNLLHLDIMDTLQKSNFDVEAFMQMESSYNGIEFVPETLLKSVDKLLLSRWISKLVAERYNYKIQYGSPTPLMYPIHLSVWNTKKNKNLFFDPDGDMELSEIGRSFIAGVLANFDIIDLIIKALSFEKKSFLITKNISNSNDNSFLCCPLYFIEKEKHERIGWSKRVLIRGITPETNLYIVLAAIVLFGINGIVQKIKMEDYIDSVHNNESIPIPQKIEYLKNNELLRDVFGRAFVDYIVEESVKKHETNNR